MTARYPDGSMTQFDNRMRILMHLPAETWPENLVAANPHSAGLWYAQSRLHIGNRLLAFIRAPDNVRQILWQAVLDYEAGATDD